MTALIQEAHYQQKHGHASRLAGRASSPVSAPRVTGGDSPMLPDRLQLLLRETTPRRRLDDLVLGRHLRSDVSELIEEISQTALLRSHSLEPLRSHSLEPRHTVLLVGRRALERSASLRYWLSTGDE
jgi:hypothetical protein